jgi:hypothetical protein
MNGFHKMNMSFYCGFVCLMIEKLAHMTFTARSLHLRGSESIVRFFHKPSAAFFLCISKVLSFHSSGDACVVIIPPRLISITFNAWSQLNSLTSSITRSSQRWTQCLPQV